MATTSNQSLVTSPRPSLDKGAELKHDLEATAVWLPMLEGGPTPLLERRNVFRHLLTSLTAPLSHNRHAAVIGEAGAGKSALLDKLDEFLQSSDTLITLPLTFQPAASVKHREGDNDNKGVVGLPILIDSLLVAWQAFSEELLDQALDEINAINHQLGIMWDRGDLLRALSLMKLQTDVDALVPSGEFLPRQQLTNAIRSAIPPVKKLHFSAVNQAIRRLVDILQQPWLGVAGQISAPTAAPVRACFDSIEGLIAPEKAYDNPWATLTAFHQWVDGVMTGGERALVMVDDWETHAKDHPTLTNDWLTFLQQSKNQRIQTVLACRAENISQTLAGPILANSQPPVMLPALSPSAEAALLTQHLNEIGEDPMTCHPTVLAKLRQVTGGLPLLTETMATTLANQAKVLEVNELSLEQWLSLGLQTPSDLWEMLFNRVVVAHLPHEGNVLRVMAALRDRLNTLATTTGQLGEGLEPLVTHIHQSQQLGRVFVTSVLHHLTHVGFLAEISTEHEVTELTWANRLAEEVITNKTRWVEADVPCEEKLVYLKKVIPLSIQAGEFDAQRTQEAIALASSDGFAELKPFLENTLTEAAHPAQPLPQRLNAVNCLATLATASCIEVLTELIDDNEATLREYSLRHLKTLAQEHQLSASQGEIICKALLPVLDTPDNALRSLAYQTMASLPLDHASSGMTAVYLKGLADKWPPIRHLAIQQLHHADMNTAMVRHAMIDATQDDDVEVRRQACLNLQRHPHPKAVEALLAVLEHDNNPQLRALAVRLIAQLPGNHTLPTLLTALNWELDTDVQITLVRALRRFPGERIEDLLCQKLFAKKGGKLATPIELQWAIVQTLGDIGQAQTTVNALERLIPITEDPFLLSACQQSLGLIRQRAIAAPSHPGNAILVNSVEFT